jgi:hypothetical protein
MIEMEREVNRFEALGVGGKRYTVIERRTVIVHRSLRGPPQEVLGSRSFSLSTGGDVNPSKDEGVFQILDTNEIIRAMIRAP